MNKFLKLIFVFLQIIIVLALVFFAFDINRVNKNEKPMFSIKTGVFTDGSEEYFGLFYKTIKYINPKVKKEYEYKTGTIFMKYKNPFLTDYIDVNELPF